MNLGLNKREKIITASVILSLGLLSTQLVPLYLTYRFIIGLSIAAYLLSLWALWEGINKLKAVILMILPTLFSLAVASFYFLLPIGWWTRIPVAFIFGLAFYTLLLSQNVFSVASIRTIPLHRVASTTVFILTLLTAYLLFNVVYSFNLLFIWNGVAVFLLALPLVLQVIWSIEMEDLSSLVVVYSLVLALILGELGLVLSFWPISKAMISLVLSTGLYVVLGVGTHHHRERLSRGVVWEYLGWGAAIFLIAAFTTSWTG
ncbi:MAG: hypothetical protein Q7S44_00630 [bacterium]|nr:hypothetical protein [bacterium]